MWDTWRETTCKTHRPSILPDLMAVYLTLWLESMAVSKSCLGSIKIERWTVWRKLQFLHHKTAITGETHRVKKTTGNPRECLSRTGKGKDIWWQVWCQIWYQVRGCSCPCFPRVFFVFPVIIVEAIEWLVSLLYWQLSRRFVSIERLHWNDGWLPFEGTSCKDFFEDVRWAGKVIKSALT